jgi:hypothetical protein
MKHSNASGDDLHKLDVKLTIGYFCDDDNVFDSFFQNDRTDVRKKYILITCASSVIDCCKVQDIWYHIARMLPFCSYAGFARISDGNREIMGITRDITDFIRKPPRFEIQGTFNPIPHELARYSKMRPFCSTTLPIYIVYGFFARVSNEDMELLHSTQKCYFIKITTDSKPPCKECGRCYDSTSTVFCGYIANELSNKYSCISSSAMIGMHLTQQYNSYTYIKKMEYKNTMREHVISNIHAACDAHLIEPYPIFTIITGKIL